MVTWFALKAAYSIIPNQCVFIVFKKNRFSPKHNAYKKEMWYNMNVKKTLGRPLRKEGELSKEEYKETERVKGSKSKLVK